MQTVSTLQGKNLYRVKIANHWDKRDKSVLCVGKEIKSVLK